MKHISLLTLLLVSFLCAMESAQPKLRKNSLEFQPLSLMNGFAGDYSRLITEKFGIQVGGNAVLWDVWGTNAKGGAARLYFPFYIHSKKKHKGMSAPYLAPFVRYEKSGADVKGDGTYNYETNSYDDITRYSVEAINIGGVFGRRWIFDSGFNLGIRAGYGFYPMFKSDWGDNPDVIDESMRETTETVGKILGGLDLGFHIGGSF